jgi:hypothetical protein
MSQAIEQTMLKHYPSPAAVVTRTDAELAADLQTGLRLPSSRPAGGPITGWISQEITRRRLCREGSPAAW